MRLKDADGKTALHRAVESGNVDIVKEILCACPDLKNEVDSKGNIALNYIRNNDLKKLFD